MPSNAELSLESDQGEGEGSVKSSKFLVDKIRIDQI